jgi:hypothetical protein
MNARDSWASFDAVVSELQHLKTAEQSLARLFSRLESNPELRTHFLRELASLRMRADRLDAALSPAGASAPAARLSGVS